MQETTLIQPNNDNIVISIETDINDVADANNHHQNEHENGNKGYGKRIRINDNNLVVIKGCDEITSEQSHSVSDRTSSRTNDTSIS